MEDTVKAVLEKKCENGQEAFLLCINHYTKTHECVGSSVGIDFISSRSDIIHDFLKYTQECHASQALVELEKGTSVSNAKDQKSCTVPAEEESCLQAETPLQEVISVDLGEAYRGDTGQGTDEETTQLVEEIVEGNCIRIKSELEDNGAEILVDLSDCNTDYPVPATRNRLRKVSKIEANALNNNLNTCKVCGKKFRSANALSGHIHVHSDAERSGITIDEKLRNEVNKFKCEVCGTGFQFESRLRQHQKLDGACVLTRTTTDNDPLIKYTDRTTAEEKEMALSEILKLITAENTNRSCLICGKALTKFSYIRRHILSMHADNYRPYICDLCDASFKFADPLHRHRVTVHKNELKEVCVQCRFCKNFFEDKNALEKHMTYKCRKRDKARNVCEICGYKAGGPKALKEHVEGHAGIKSYECEICEKKLANSSSLNRHRIVIHSAAKPFSCSMCGQRFKLKENVTAHMKFHEEPKYKCDICHRSFHNASYFKKHLMYHTNEKPFTCEICGKSFRQKKLIDTHLRTHKGDRSFTCGVCQKGFYCYDNLKAHEKLHGEPAHMCDICGKTFITAGRMNYHRKIHFGTRTWMCKYCENQFKSIISFKNHLARCHPEKQTEIEQNSSIRLHRCDRCDRVFGTADDLKRHIYIHDGSKPFSCKICSKCFNDKCNLRQHENIHLNRKYSCSYCKRSFQLHSSLLKHTESCSLATVPRSATGSVTKAAVPKELSDTGNSSSLVTFTALQSSVSVSEGIHTDQEMMVGSMVSQSSTTGEQVECEQAIDSILQQNLYTSPVILVDRIPAIP